MEEEEEEEVIYFPSCRPTVRHSTSDRSQIHIILHHLIIYTVSYISKQTS
jgi:hypothetical protein